MPNIASKPWLSTSRLRNSLNEAVRSMSSKSDLYLNDRTLSLTDWWGQLCYVCRVWKGAAMTCWQNAWCTKCEKCLCRWDRVFFSPKLECPCIPLPEADGAISSSGGQVALGAATERRKLQTQPIRGNGMNRGQRHTKTQSFSLGTSLSIPVCLLFKANMESANRIDRLQQQKDYMSATPVSYEQQTEATILMGSPKLEEYCRVWWASISAVTTRCWVRIWSQHIFWWLLSAGRWHKAPIISKWFL